MVLFSTYDGDIFYVLDLLATTRGHPRTVRKSETHYYNTVYSMQYSMRTTRPVILEYKLEVQKEYSL